MSGHADWQVVTDVAKDNISIFSVRVLILKMEEL
jgi:hypothetical protein